MTPWIIIYIVVFVVLLILGAMCAGVTENPLSRVFINAALWPIGAVFLIILVLITILGALLG